MSGVTPPVAVVVKAPEPKKLNQYEQTFQQGGRVVRVKWFEVAPNKWKQFDNEKDAEKYKLDNAAPEKSDDKTPTAAQPVS